MLISWWIVERGKFSKELVVVGLDIITSATCFRSCASCGDGFMLPSGARMLVVRCLYSWANWGFSRSVDGGMGGSIIICFGEGLLFVCTYDTEYVHMG